MDYPKEQDSNVRERKEEKKLMQDHFFYLRQWVIKWVGEK